MGVKTFLLMAGGTGGHIFPALAVAAALRERGHKVVWLGSEGAMETRIVPQHGIEIETLAIKGVRGNGLKRKLMLPFTLWHTIRAARSIISIRWTAPSASAASLPCPAGWRPSCAACRW